MNRYLFLSILFFCLGTVLEFNGGTFGNPYLQHIALVATWLPVTLVALRHYYYSSLPALTAQVAPQPVDSNATSEPVPPV